MRKHRTIKRPKQKTYSSKQGSDKNENVRYDRGIYKRPF